MVRVARREVIMRVFVAGGSALHHGTPGSAYNIVDNEAVSISAIVRTLAAEAGARPPFAVPRGSRGWWPLT